MTTPFLDLIPPEGRRQAGSSNPFDDLVPTRLPPAVVTAPAPAPIYRAPPAVVSARPRPSRSGVPIGAPVASPAAQVRANPLTTPIETPKLNRLAVLAGANAGPQEPGLSPLEQDIRERQPMGFFDRLAEGIGSMAAHPIETASAPFKAVADVTAPTKGSAAEAQLNDPNSPNQLANVARFGRTIPVTGVTRGDRLAAAFQLGGMALAAPAGGAVTELLSPLAFEGATLPAATALRGYGAAIAGRAAGGAVAGMPFAPQDPGVGAALGALAGGTEAAAAGRVGVRRYQPPNAYPEDVTRQIGTGPQPGPAPPKVSVTGRVLDAPNYPAEPDYAVEANEPPPQASPFVDLIPKRPEPSVRPVEASEGAKAPSVEPTAAEPTAPKSGAAPPIVAPTHDYTKLSDAELADHFDALDEAFSGRSPRDPERRVALAQRDAVGDEIDRRQEERALLAKPPAVTKTPVGEQNAQREQNPFGDLIPGVVGQIKPDVLGLLSHESESLASEGTAAPGPTEQDAADRRDVVPEKTDLFGKPVAPAVEQGGLFAEGTGTQLQRDELKQLGRKDHAITPEEMAERRDVLGAPKPPDAHATRLRARLGAAEREMAALEKKLSYDPLKDSFPLGTGSVKPRSGAVRFDADKQAQMAKRFLELKRQTEHLRGEADAYEKGEITAQGRKHPGFELRQAEKALEAGHALRERGAWSNGRALTDEERATLDETIRDLEKRAKVLRKRAAPAEGPAKIQKGSRYEGDENPEALLAGAKQQARGYLVAHGAFQAKISHPSFQKLNEKKRTEIVQAGSRALHHFESTLSEVEQAFGTEAAASLRRELLLEAKRSSEPTPAPTKAKKPNRKPVENFVNKKHRLETNDDLYTRAAELEARIQEYGSGEHGSPLFVRDAVDLTKPISGYTAVQRRLEEDGRLYNDVLAELRARHAKDGLSPEEAEDLIDEQIATREQGPVVKGADDFSPGEFTSEMKTGEGTVGAGFDRSLFKKLGANLYKGDIATIAVKEGLQNAVDALRQLGPNEQGNGVIKIDINPEERQIRIVDNGVGMAPDTAANEFMDIGGSLKGADASGGFGLAKVGLLASSEHFKMITVADTPKGRMATTIEGSGTDWANGTLKYSTEPIPRSAPTGTQLTIKLEPSAETNFYSAREFVKSASHFGRLPYRIEATQTQGGRAERFAPIDTAKLPSYSPYVKMKSAPLTTLTTPGASATVYESEASGPAYGVADTHVLNNGLHQFTLQMQVGETGPKSLVIDVHPTASIDSPNYPFTTNREQLKGPLEQTVKEFGKKIREIAGKREIETLVEMLEKAPQIEGSPAHVVVDTTGKTPAKVLEDLSTREYVAKLADLSERAMDRIVAEMEKLRNIPRPFFGGLSSAASYLGVNINTAALKAAAVQHGGSTDELPDGNLIFYNPWTTFREAPAVRDTRDQVPYDESDRRVADDAALARWFADRWWGTMAHEVAHQLERGHTEGFAGLMTRIMSELGRIQGEWLAEADALFGTMVAPYPGEFLADYSIIQRHYSQNTNDLFKKFSDEQRGKRGKGAEGARGVDGGDSRRDAMAEHEGASPSRGERSEDVGNAGRGAVPNSARGSGARGAAGAGVSGAHGGSGSGGGAGGGVGSVAPGAHPTPEAPGFAHQRSAFRPLEIVRAIKLLINPESLGAEAQGAAGTIGHQAAISWRQLAIASEALRDFGRAVGKLSKADAVKMWDAAEHGRSTGNPTFDAGNALLHQITEQYTRELVKRDKLRFEAVIDDYIGRFWTKKNTPIADVLRIIRGKRPVEGPKSFLKHRTLENFTDGLDAGLTPATYNYVDAQLAKIAEMQRVIAADEMLKQEKRHGRAKPVMMGQPTPLDANGDKWVQIDREGNDPAFSIFLPPEFAHWEAVDAVVYGKLQALVKQLNVLHERKPHIGGSRLGYAEGGHKIATKFGGAEGVISHELGHILDFQYGLGDAIDAAIGKAPTRTATKGKKAGQQVPDYKSEEEGAAAKRKALREELRQLANLRDETLKGVPQTKDLSASRKAYLHSTEEKMANMVEAYIHLRPRFKKVAPGIFKIFDRIVEEHPELHALRDIEPSLAREAHGATERIPGVITGGHWYAPRDAAAVWRNHLSRGLRGNPLFDAYMAPVQASQQILLGLSGFHGTVIATEGAFSELALAADNFINAGGKATAGAAHAGKTIAAPVANALLGRQVMREYRRPGTHPEFAKVIDAMISGGWKGKSTSEFWTGERKENFKRALQKTLHNDSEARRLWNASKLPLDAVWALVEATAVPVLAKYVPLMKTGALYTAMAEKLAKLPQGIALDDLHRETRDLVKEMDYRFGQVDYENFFLNNAVKNLAQMVFLAPGWTFGTIALAERGVSDLAKLPYRGYQRAKHGPRTPEGIPRELVGKSAAYWVFGAVLGTVIINGLLTWLNTGERPKGKDFWAFRDGTKDADGNENRHVIPGYLMKDIYSWSHHPVDTFKNKLSPMLAFIGRFATNRTYFGDEIYNPEDPLATRLKQTGREVLREDATPLSVQNFLESQKRNEGGAGAVARNVFGVTPVKRELQRTPGQNKLAEVLARRGHTARTPEEVDVAKERTGFRQELRAGTKTGRDVGAAVRAGDLTKRQAVMTIKGAHQNPQLRQFQQLTAEEALLVYNSSDSPAERKLWYPYLKLKRARAIINGVPAARLPLPKAP